MTTPNCRCGIGVITLAVPTLLAVWACSDPQGLDECEARAPDAQFADVNTTTQKDYRWPEILEHAPPDSVVLAAAKGDQSEIISLVEELGGKLYYVYHTIAWVAFFLQVQHLEEVANAPFVYDFTVAPADGVSGNLGGWCSE